VIYVMAFDPRDADYVIGHDIGNFSMAHGEICGEIGWQDHPTGESHFASGRQFVSYERRTGHSGVHVFFPVTGRWFKDNAPPFAINANQLHVYGETKHLQLLEDNVSIIRRNERSQKWIVLI
jgi:hypothetical protein